MKILFVSHTAEWSGAEHCLYSLLHGINRRKYEPLVVLPGRGHLEKNLRSLGVETQTIDLRWWCRQGFTDRLKQRVEALSGLIQRKKIDLVFTNTSLITEGALAAQLMEIPHIWSLHELVFSVPELQAFLEPSLFANVLLALSDKLVVNSHRTQREIQANLETEKLELIYPALPSFSNKTRAENQNEPGRNGRVPQVCFVGIIARQKGVFCLAEAAPEILKRFPQTRFVLVGKDAGALDALKSAVKKREMEHAFRFLGFREDVSEVIRNSDLLVLPSFAESFGLVLLEAMSLGKPTVATRCGGPEEIVLDGETGILVPVNDSSSLAQAIISLLENPQKMRLMGQRGKERVERMFAYDHSIKKFENLFDEAFSMRRENPLMKEVVRILLDLLDETVTSKDRVIFAHQKEFRKLSAEYKKFLQYKDTLEKEYGTLHEQFSSVHEQFSSASRFIEKLTQSPEGRLALKCRSLFEKLAPLHSKRRAAYHRVVKNLQAVRKNPGQTAISPPQAKTPRRDRAVCTVASKNYLGYLRTFSQSFLKHHPDIRVYVLLVDKVEGTFEPANEPFETLLAEELDNVPNPSHLFFKYSAIELNTALKPYFFEHLFKKLPIQKLIFFDPDIVLFDNLETVWGLLATNSLVLTPHLLAPYRDHAHPGELHIHQAGIFNLGFIGMSRTSSTSRFLEWWKNRLYNHCFMRPDKGMHVDQKWVDFAPAMFEGVYILRDPAYNIAYWNLHERGTALKFKEGKLTLEDRHAVFFHFSGFDFENIEKISRHQNRFTLRELPNLTPLFEYYRDRLLTAGQTEAQAWPYFYGRFDNGVRIPPPARKAYADLGNEALRFGDPFSTRRPHSFFAWLNQAVDGGNGKPGPPPITRLIWEIYQSRPDLQRAYPDPLGKDRQNFCEWLRVSDAKEYDLDDSFIPQGAVDESGRTLSCCQETRGRKSPAELRREVRTAFGKALRKSRGALQKLKSLGCRRRISFGRSPAFGVNIAGYLKGQFGVAEAARASVRSLAAAKIPYVLNDLRAGGHRHEDGSFERLLEGNPYLFNLVHVNADETHNFLRLKGPRYFRRHYNIGVWFWELSKFPEEWASSFAPYREIWTGSTFCQQSLSQISPIPVLRITFPFLIEENTPEPDRSRFNFPQDSYIFLFQFDFLSIFERKNPLAVLEAFERVFGDKEDVLLVFKSINSIYDPKNMARLKRSVRAGNVRFLDEYLSRRDFFRLMAACDCYVSLHRSEGIGQGMVYAMHMGKPVIATAYSGNLDFMNSENSFLVPSKLTELDKDYGPYKKGNVWAEPDVDRAAELMKRVCGDRETAARKARRAQEEIRRHTDPEACGGKMAERLRLLEGLF